MVTSFSLEVFKVAHLKKSRCIYYIKLRSRSVDRKYFLIIVFRKKVHMPVILYKLFLHYLVSGLFLSNEINHTIRRS